MKDTYIVIRTTSLILYFNILRQFRRRKALSITYILNEIITRHLHWGKKQVRVCFFFPVISGPSFSTCFGKSALLKKSTSTIFGSFKDRYHEVHEVINSSTLLSTATTSEEQFANISTFHKVL